MAADNTGAVTQPGPKATKNNNVVIQEDEIEQATQLVYFIHSLSEDDEDVGETLRKLRKRGLTADKIISRYDEAQEQISEMDTPAMYKFFGTRNPARTSQPRKAVKTS